MAIPRAYILPSSDFELKKHYGWSPARAGGARAHLEYLTPREWPKGELDLDTILDLFYDVLLFAMRSICLVRRHGTGFGARPGN